MNKLAFTLAAILLVSTPTGLSNKILEFPDLVSYNYNKVYNELCNTQNKINKSRKADYNLINLRDKLRKEKSELEKIAENSNFRIEIIKKDFMLKVYEKGLLVNTYQIAIGKRHRTKEGIYRIVDKMEVAYFPKADALKGWNKYRKAGSLILDSKEGMVIHGTSDEQSLGKAVSSGCIRMKKADAMYLSNIIPIRTYVRIR
jgi:lipoprotein-anchoring transpeptidase ErfK/SrfK